jgi:hypothetical protein
VIFYIDFVRGNPFQKAKIIQKLSVTVYYLQKPPLPEIEGTGKDENETKEGTHDFFSLHSLNQINL